MTPDSRRGTTEKISRLRKIIAERMIDSLQTSAQLTQVVEVDVTNVARLRESVKSDFLAREGVKLTYLPFFAKAAIDRSPASLMTGVSRPFSVSTAIARFSRS